MIYINYNGRFGNNIFQYCIGRIIAEKYGHGLERYKGENNQFFENCKVELQDQSYARTDNISVLKGHYIDFSKCNSSQIVLDGFFQRAEYYLPYREKIKKWFEPPPLYGFSPSKDDFFLHIRRADFGRPWNGGMLPFSFYTDILNTKKFDRVFISGGTAALGGQKDVDEDVINAFKMYDPIYINESSIETFKMIQRFTNVIQSMSTFCWWATFLSDECKNVYTPITTSGYWSKDSDINLRIDDKKYIYIDNVDVEHF